MNEMKINWRLFDGEGGEDGSAGLSEAAMIDSLGPDARAFLESMGAKLDDSSTPVESNAEEGTQPVEESAVESEPSEEEPSFEELIAKGGKYHEEYGKAVQDVIQKRFKNQADNQSTIDSYDELLSDEYAKYGIEKGNIEGLKNAIAADEDFFASQAEKQGMTVDQFKAQLKLQREAEEGRRIKAEYEAEQHRSEVFAQWDAEADELKKSFPEFDLGMEIDSNERFANLIDSGASVSEAFFATHAAEILGGMSAESSNQAKRDVINRINERASRPIENGIKHNAATAKKFDPSSMSSEDVIKVLDELARGGSPITL